MPIDMSILAPQGNMPQGNMPQGGMPAGGAPVPAPTGGQRANPGGIQAIRDGVKYLMQLGMNPEEILEALLKIVERLGLDIPEEAIQQIINTMGEGGAPAGGGMPAGAPLPQEGMTNV